MSWRTDARIEVDNWEDAIDWYTGQLENQLAGIRAPRYRHLRDWGPDLEYEQELYDTATGINSPFLEAKQDFYDIQAEFYEREPEQVNPGLMDPAGNVPVDIPAALEVRDEIVEEWIEQQHAPDVIQETVSSLENPSMWGPNAQGTWSPEEEEEEILPGVNWDPMGLTNLLGDQIGLINELAQAGILNAQEWQATTMDTIDGIWGDLEADFQAQVDTLSEGELASLENLGLSADTIAGELADMGVEGAVLSLEEQAIADAMALQSGNQMDFAQNLISSAQIGQADRETTAMNTFNDIIMGIETGQLAQIGELENMAQAAQVQGQALGVDPAILFADMLYETNIAQQQMSAASAEANAAEMWAMADYLAMTVPDFGGDPMLAYSVLSGMLPGNYFKPQQQSFMDSLQPGIIGALQQEIQDIMNMNQNISFQDAVYIAVDSLYNLPE